MFYLAIVFKYNKYYKGEICNPAFLSLSCCCLVGGEFGFIFTSKASLRKNNTWSRGNRQL